MGRNRQHQPAGANPPQAEREKFPEENPAMNNHQPFVQKMEWAPGAEQGQVPSMAPGPNHSAVSHSFAHSAQWDSLIERARASAKNSQASPMNTGMPIVAEGAHPPPPRATLPKAAPGSLPAQPPGTVTAPAPPPSAKPKGPRQQAEPAARDPIVPPSAESGGIPEPTAAYLLRASFLPQALVRPRPMLVVMDLNGTLLHRPNKRNPSRFVARPHARAFLTYCIDTFHVVIWSSAREANVAAMCADLLSPAQRSRVLAVWGRSRFGLCPADFNRRVQCYKRLTSVWADPAVAAAHPTGGAWDQGNTVLVDDSAEKARSEPFNAVQIPEFVGGGGGDGAAAAAAAGEAGSGDADDALILPRVHDYLNTLACQQDISMYIRANPFRA